MKKTTILFVFIIFTFHTFLTAQTIKFPGENSYSKGKIYFKNNNRIEVTNLKITDDHLSFTNKSTRQPGEYDLSDTYIIKVSEGTKVGEYALIGGAVMGVSAALAILPYADDDMYDAPPTGPWILGWTIGGVVIGAIIGANQEKWKTIYVNEHASLIKSLKYDFCFNHKNNNIICKLTFGL